MQNQENKNINVQNAGCGGKNPVIRTVIFLMAMILCAVCFNGCGNYIPDDGKKQIVCTVFPEYDWLMNILGDEAENYHIRLILDTAADMHSYQPTAEDIAAVSSCDLLIYVGGESDGWIEDALKNKVNDNMQIINLMECMGDRALEEEVIEGMHEGLFGHNHGDSNHEDGEVHEDEHEEVEDHNDHDADDQVEGSHTHVHEGEYDEHVWLSLKNAEIFVEAITGELIKLSPEKADVFESNARVYTEKLEELDGLYFRVVTEGHYSTLLFADRFPFRYLIEDYEITYYAAFSGCSADAEAGFDTVVYLANRISDEKLPAVIILENSDGRLAETIIDNSGCKDVEILVLDSMQSVSGKQREEGYTYLSVMESNLGVLKKALQ
ncbi:MAG: metal ABC transporter substrate-binding protein [Lachnospiraceae bacterium]